MDSPVRQIVIQEMMDASGVQFGTSGARGLVLAMPSELCFAYASAFLQAISVSSGRVALGMDLRPSSPAIASACAAAIQHAGLHVDFCGAIPTPALAYYAQTRGQPAIMVTGSHIPFDRNGIKFYGLAGEITKSDEENFRRAVVAVPHEGLAVPLPEVNHEAYRMYIERYLAFFPVNALKGMRLGFYEHSCVARELFRELLERLGAAVISLGRTDAFVPIDTEAVSAADARQARDWAAQFGFDAILSMDGDADRPLFGDERGQWLRGDVVGLLCARYLGAQAVATTVNGNSAIEQCGSFPRVVRTRIGSPYVIEGMRQLIRAGVRNVVGFEPNGGFLVGLGIEKDGRLLASLLTRDAVLPILCLLSMASEQGSKVSALIDALPARFTASDRLQDFPLAVSRLILLELATSMTRVDALLNGLCGKALSADQTDGLRIFLENDEIVHFRPSGNAPELRCYAESASQDRADALVQHCLQRIKSSAALITDQRSPPAGSQ